jgi:hypothetical protein
MTLYEFMILDAEAQIEVWFEGVYVGERALPDGYTVVCKQIDDFYVEYLKKGLLWKDMRSFRNPDLLAPYLTQIDVSDLGIQ